MSVRTTWVHGSSFLVRSLRVIHSGTFGVSWGGWMVANLPARQQLTTSDLREIGNEEETFARIQPNWAGSCQRRRDPPCVRQSRSKWAHGCHLAEKFGTYLHGSMGLDFAWISSVFCYHQKPFEMYSRSSNKLQNSLCVENTSIESHFKNAED